MWLAQPPAKRKENPPPSRESTMTRKHPPRCTSARRGDWGETFGILERCPSLQGETENTVYTTNKRIPLGFSKSFWNPWVCSYLVEIPAKVALCQTERCSLDPAGVTALGVSQVSEHLSGDVSRLSHGDRSFLFLSVTEWKPCSAQSKHFCPLSLKWASWGGEASSSCACDPPPPRILWPGRCFQKAFGPEGHFKDGDGDKGELGCSCR